MENDESINFCLFLNFMKKMLMLLQSRLNSTCNFGGGGGGDGDDGGGDDGGDGGGDD